MMTGLKFVTATSLDTERRLPGTNTSSCFNVELGQDFSLPRLGSCGVALVSISFPRDLLCRKKRRETEVDLDFRLTCSLKSLIALMLFYSRFKTHFGFVDSDNARKFGAGIQYIVRNVIQKYNATWSALPTEEEKNALTANVGTLAKKYLEEDYKRQQNQDPDQVLNVQRYPLATLRTNLAIELAWRLLDYDAMLEAVQDLHTDTTQYEFVGLQTLNVDLPWVPRLNPGGTAATAAARKKQLRAKYEALNSALQQESLLGLLAGWDCTWTRQTTAQFGMTFLDVIRGVTILASEEFFDCLALESHKVAHRRRAYSYLRDGNEEEHEQVAPQRLWGHRLADEDVQDYLEDGEDGEWPACIFLESPQLTKNQSVGGNRGILRKIPITKKQMEEGGRQIHYEAGRLVFHKITEYNHGYIILRLTDLYGRVLDMKGSVYDPTLVAKDVALGAGVQHLDHTVVELAIQNPM